MLPHPFSHQFTLEGERYRLDEYTRGGQRRISAQYAMSLSAIPGILEAVDGVNLYVEALARECLKDAPAFWWEDVPAPSSTNGTPGRVVTFEHIPVPLWYAFCAEVNTFERRMLHDTPTTPAAPPAPGPTESAAMATPQAVPPVFSGRAE